MGALKGSPDSGEVAIRSASHSPRDASVTAVCLRQAAPDYFSSLLGAQAQRVLTDIAAEPGHAWSPDRVRIAETGGSPVGALIGGPADRHYPEAAAAMPWSLGRLRAHAIDVLWWPCNTFLSQHAPNEWYINAVAVSPEARGRGVGRLLIRSAVTDARESGLSTVALHVDGTNAKALGLYESEGFTISDTWSPRWLPGNVLVHRMAMPLSGA